MKMVSLNEMVKQLARLKRDDLDSFEQQFVNTVVTVTQAGRFTSVLSSKQAEFVENLYMKHFG